MITSLFMMHFGSNVGYAITPLEDLFYRTGIELSGGNPERVHFSYTDLSKGKPNNLPDSFNNIFLFDPKNATLPNFEYISKYIMNNCVNFVLAFDLHPLHPIYKHLRRSGVKTILSYYGAPISSRMPAWKLLLKKLQVAFSRSKVDGLIFESRSMADFAVNGRGIPSGMIDVVPLGVDTHRFTHQPSDYVFEVLNIPREKKVVVYAGHMESRKGVATLIEAAIELLYRRKRTDVFFFICGNKGDESSALEAMYTGLGIGESICFGGYRDDLDRVFPSCYCGVIPSTGWDSFPRTSLEMAACGLPLIVSRLQGLPETIAEGETGLCYEPGDSQELVGHLEYLLNQPEVARRLGRNGRKRCEEEFSLNIQRSRFIAAVRKRLKS